MRGLKLFILLFLFTACVNGYRHGTIEVAVAEGIIIQPGLGDVTAVHDFEIVPVRRGNMVRNVNLPVTGHFVVHHRLSFSSSGGEFTNIIQSPVFTKVSEGDILGTQFFSERLSESYELERDRLEFEIEVFETRIQNERRLHQTNIAAARNTLQNAAPEYREIARLNLEKLQLQLNRFNNSANEERENLNARMERISTITTNLYAPFDGILTFVSTAPRNIRAGHVYFAIACESYFEFRVDSLMEVIRFGNIFPMAWDCPKSGERMSIYAIVVSDALVIPRGDILRQYSLQPLDPVSFNEKLLSLNMTVFDLLEANLRLEVSEVLIYDALILHERAIRTELEAEYVVIYDSGRFLKRYITTGFRFITDVQILMGVEYGQKVVMP